MERGADRIHTVGARVDVQRVPLDGPFGTGDPAGEGVDARVDEEPFGRLGPHLGEPVGVPARVLEDTVDGVLQAAPDGSRLQEPLDQLLRRKPVPSLDVRRHRHVHRPDDPRDGRGHLVGRSPPVRVAEAGGDPGARRGQRRETGVGRHPGTGRVPRPGQDRGVTGKAASVQSPERLDLAHGVWQAPGCRPPAPSPPTWRHGARHFPDNRRFSIPECGSADRVTS